MNFYSFTVLTNVISPVFAGVLMPRAVVTVDIPSYTFPPAPAPTYAIGVSKNNHTTSYGPHYSEVSTLLGNFLTTTWGSWNRNATITAEDAARPYGNYAWTHLWIDAKFNASNTSAIYSTTVSPTPIPSSSLILPPPDVFSFDKQYQFPKGFLFGVAGSAGQIEGASHEEGKGPSLIEKMVQSPHIDSSVTNENYYLYKQDIMRLAAMGVETYSFSIPWTRILPFAVKESPVNQLGLNHYDDLINFCISQGITPMVTLHHFDTPLRYVQNENPDNSFKQIYGGFDNETFVEDFVNYGKIVLTHFSDRVSTWVTFNQPFSVVGNPVGAKNALKAHAQLYKFYHQELKATGKMGIKFSAGTAFPFDPSNQTDVQAAQRYQALTIEPLALPLAIGKQQPDIYRQVFSGSPGLLSDEEIKEVANTLDFFGIDPYVYITATAGSINVDQCLKNSSNTAWPYCSQQLTYQKDGWAVGDKGEGRFGTTPVQIRSMFNYLWDTFQVPIIVTEFGLPQWAESEKTQTDQLFDQERSIYFRLYMDAILKAIHVDEVEIIGATAWSFIDNWEFGSYKEQFGLQAVNRTTQQRYYKKSFFDFVQYYRERKAE